MINEIQRLQNCKQLITDYFKTQASQGQSPDLQSSHDSRNVKVFRDFVAKKASIAPAKNEDSNVSS